MRIGDRLAMADQAGVGGDADDQDFLAAIGFALHFRDAQVQRLDALDLHCSPACKKADCFSLLFVLTSEFLTCLTRQQGV
jgi:hypothetical protein